MVKQTVEIRGVSLPPERLNKLNNYYIENFGYDIHTQIHNFLRMEYEKCKDYPETEPQSQPVPSIKGDNRKDKWNLTVKYPNKTKKFVCHDDYDLLCDVWNEWSKYSFSEESKSKVYNKYNKNKHISSSKGTYRIRYGKSKLGFGTYRTSEDARKVRDFLMEHNWDRKYSFSNITKTVDGVHQYNYNDYMLKLVAGEITYDE